MMKFKHWETQSSPRSSSLYRQVTVLNDGNRYKTMVHRGSLLSQFSQIICTSYIAYLRMYKKPLETTHSNHTQIVGYHHSFPSSDAVVVFNRRNWRASPWIVIELHDKMDDTEMMAIFRSEFIPSLYKTEELVQLERTTVREELEFADEVLRKFEQRAETVLEHQQRYLGKKE